MQYFTNAEIGATCGTTSERITLQEMNPEAIKCRVVIQTHRIYMFNNVIVIIHETINPLPT